MVNPVSSNVVDAQCDELFRHLSIASHVINAHYWRYDLPELKLVWSKNSDAEPGTKHGELNDLNTTIWNTIHPEDLQRVRSLLANLPTDTGSFEFRRMTDKDAVCYLRASYQCFRNDNGSPSHIIGATQDISNEVLAKQQLEQQACEMKSLHERLERAAQSSQEGHWEADFVTGKHWCSDVYRQLLGYGPDHDFSTMESYQAICHPDELEGQYHMVMALKDGEAYERTIRLKHVDGTWRWMQVRGSLQRDTNGQPVRLTGNIRSVHEQTMMQKQLDEYQQRFSRAIRGTQDGLWELNLKTHEVWMSPRCAEMLGYTALEVIQWNENNLASITHIDDITMVRAALRDARHGKPCDLEYRIRTKDYRWRWVNVRGTASLDETNQGVSVSGSLQDVTEAHEAREKLLRATAEAEAANRAKSTFLANMSHELRTPMNGIIGMSQLLASTPLNDAQHEFADIINSSAQSLLSIINDILDISKIEASKLNIEHIDVNLRDIVEDAVAMMANQIADKPIELILDIQPDLPTTIQGDPQRIRQCLLNLMSNAYKFTQQGQILVTVNTKTIDGNSMLEFAVTDSGVGIASEAMARLFRPFAQADSSTTRRFGGTGLGLSIVKNLVELMGGKINVTSEAGKGSRFWFSLPLESVAPVVIIDSTAHRNTRLMVIDDNRNQRDALVRQLTFQGYHVDAAADIAHANALLDSTSTMQCVYSALFVNEKMAELENDLLNQQRCHELRLQNTHCILMTVINRKCMADRLARVLSICTLSKPVRHRELQKLLTMLDNGTLSDIVEKPVMPVTTSQKASTSTEIVGVTLPGEVLLVEDNIVNQKVAMRFLQRLGAKVTVANNGAEGVELIKRSDFSLVLMDVQMPVMDGYEATRAIRELSSTKRSVPIVALTANAMPEDRQRCLEAGMNEFLTKPLQLDQLTPIVQQYCNHTATHDQEMSEAQVQTLLDNTAPDTSAKLESQVDLSKLHDVVGDDAFFFSELVDAYRQTVRETFSELQVALDSADKAGIARTAHKLKGASSNMCIFPVSNLAAKLESEIASLGNADMKVLIGKLDYHIQAAISELTHMVETHKPAA